MRKSDRENKRSRPPRYVGTMVKKGGYKMNSSERRFYRRSWAPVLEQWRWQWFWTQTYPENKGFRFETVVKDLKKSVRELCKSESIQIGCAFAVSRICRTVHLHIVMIGHNRYGKTLYDVSDASRQKFQDGRPHRARVDIVRSAKGSSKYLASHFRWAKSDHAEIDFYNLPLLNRMRMRLPHRTYPDLAPHEGDDE